MENHSMLDHSITALTEDKYNEDNDLGTIIPIITEEHEVTGCFNEFGDFISVSELQSSGKLSQFDFHALDAFLYFLKFDTSFVIIVDELYKYKGTITYSSLFSALKQTMFIPDEYAYLHITSSYSNFSFSDLNIIMESENTNILHHFTEKLSAEESMVSVHVIINRNQLYNLVDLLELKGYTVENYYTNDSEDKILKDRYDNLINYLTT